ALGYRLMDSKTRRVYTSRNDGFFEKKEDNIPSPDSPDVDISLVVKTKVDVPADDDSDYGDD
ncbi:hypothetical protein KI387_012533, partial [Taxus chinensis]